MFLSAIPNPPPGVIVVLVSQPGCGACDEYLPVFQQVAAPYAARGLAIMHIDATDQRPEVQSWMDQFKVESTPTTYVLRHQALGGGAWKVEGAVDAATVARTLDYAERLGSRVT